MNKYIDSEVEFDHVSNEQVTIFAAFAAHTKAEMKLAFEGQERGNVVKLKWKDKNVSDLIVLLTALEAVSEEKSPREIMNGVMDRVSKLGFNPESTADIEAAIQLGD